MGVSTERKREASEELVTAHLELGNVLDTPGAKPPINAVMGRLSPSIYARAVCILPHQDEL